MPKSPTEPTNLVLEQLRLMRADFAALDAKFDTLALEIKGLKASVRGIGGQVIAEVYKANKTVASFADLEFRLEAVERKVFT